MLKRGDGFVHGIVVFAEGDSGCALLRRLLGFGDVGGGFVSEVADRLYELGECVARDVGSRGVEVFIEEIIDQLFGLLESFPAALTGNLEAKIPESLVFDVLGFDGGESGAGKMLTPGGGTLRPIVARAEIADGFVRTAGFFSNIGEAGLWAEFEVDGECGEGISGFAGEAFPELRVRFLGSWCLVFVLVLVLVFVHKIREESGLGHLGHLGQWLRDAGCSMLDRAPRKIRSRWDIWDILGHLGHVSEKKFVPGCIRLVDSS